MTDLINAWKLVAVLQVLALKNGSIRIGLDIGAGSGTFAARMSERNVTILSTTLNLDGPFNEMIAMRGLLTLHLTVSQRFPFFDNTLDIVHSMHVLSNWMPRDMLEFILFDIHRILRPGGIFWLDRFFCAKDQLDTLYTPMFTKFGYRKIKWAVGKKPDFRGQEQVYVSAIYEKLPLQ
jgi:SAM-dependent methyltransferase